MELRFVTGCVRCVFFDTTQKKKIRFQEYSIWLLVHIGRIAVFYFFFLEKQNLIWNFLIWNKNWIYFFDFYLIFQFLIYFHTKNGIFRIFKIIIIFFIFIIIISFHFIKWHDMNSNKLGNIIIMNETKWNWIKLNWIEFNRKNKNFKKKFQKSKIKNENKKKRKEKFLIESNF